MTISFRRCLTVIVACGLMCAGTATSWAQQRGITPLSAGELSAAVAAAHSPTAGDLVLSNLRRPGQPDPGKISVADTGVAAYMLDKDFVLGAAAAPAGTLDYIAVVATASSGAVATIAVRPSVEPATGWVASGVLSGDDERRLSRQLQPGTVLLNEPQINGWYALSSSGVRLLQASLPQSPVNKTVSLADYQRAVHLRYADKLPGSEYVREGGIGFTQQAPQETTWWYYPIVIVFGCAIVLALWLRRRHRNVHSQSTRIPATPGPT